MFTALRVSWYNLSSFSKVLFPHPSQVFHMKCFLWTIGYPVHQPDQNWRGSRARLCSRRSWQPAMRLWWLISLGPSRTLKKWILFFTLNMFLKFKVSFVNWGANCKPTLEGFWAQSSKGCDEQEQGVGCKLAGQKAKFVSKRHFWSCFKTKL